jgi:endonuclease/exonuclease/phosphatase family metal-dependent hydrolase
MRIVSYNILDGGVGREAQLLAVLEAQRPDLVGLVEAEEPAVVVHLARQLKMDLITAPGDSKASALLSRFPIRHTINHAPLHKELSKSLLEAAIIGPNGIEWNIGIVHLHARAAEEDEQKRELEIAEVLKIFAPQRDAGRPHLLAGDFNSNAPYQKIDPQRCKPSTRRAWEENGGWIPRRAVQRILDAGYLDSLRVVDREASETAGTLSTEFPGQRVDYIFAYGVEPARIEAAWVYSASVAREASDHFPIGVQLAERG